MNKIYKYISAASLSLLLLISCSDDGKRFPDFKEGVNARVSVDPARSFLDFGNLGTASIAFDIYSINNNIDEIVYTVTFVDSSDPTAKFPDAEITVAGSEFVNGKASVTLTSAQLVEMFGLPGGIDYLGGGDNFIFNTTATLTDGRVISGANSAPSITGGTNPSFTTQFNMLVACAFDVNEAIGTYTITADGAGVSDPAHDLQVEVIAGATPNQVILKDLFGYGKYDVTVTVNPANGAAVIALQKAWDADELFGQYGDASIAGGGFFLSCAGSLNVNIEHTVDAGSFGTFALQLTKN